MSLPAKSDDGRGTRAPQKTFFKRDDAIWLTDVAARELKEKQTAAPRFRDKPAATLGSRGPTPAAAAGSLPANEDYGPTKIVRTQQDDAQPPAEGPSAAGSLLDALFRKKAGSPSASAAPSVGRSAPAQPAPKAAAAIPTNLPAGLEQALTTKPTAKPIAAKRAAKPAKAKRERSDLIVGALGLTLGLTCAMFPWYIFFNQEQFGVREFVFSGKGGDVAPTALAYQPARIGEPFAESEVPKMNLDFFPTATTPPNDAPREAVPVAEQPFPADQINYQLVHVANGRAMIMDDAGLWVVQPGSQLPDASRVVSIEKRAGRWVIITSLDRVVELDR